MYGIPKSFKLTNFFKGCCKKLIFALKAKLGIIFINKTLTFKIRYNSFQLIPNPGQKSLGIKFTIYPYNSNIPFSSIETTSHFNVTNLFNFCKYFNLIYSIYIKDSVQPIRKGIKQVPTHVILIEKNLRIINDNFKVIKLVIS